MKIHVFTEEHIKILTNKQLEVELKLTEIKNFTLKDFWYFNK